MQKNAHALCVQPDELNVCKLNLFTKATLISKTKTLQILRSSSCALCQSLSCPSPKVTRTWFFFSLMFNRTLCNQTKQEFVHLMCSKSIKTVTELLKGRKVGYLLAWCHPGEWGANTRPPWTLWCLASEKFEGQNWGQGSPEEVDIHEWRTVRSC